VRWSDFVLYVRREPAGSLLAFDFDGTLAPIVEHPADARVDPRLADTLARLGHFVTLAVISGRSQEFLDRQLAHIGATLVGNYGRSEVGAEPTAERIAHLASRARAVFGEEIDLEYKPTSIALHYRRNPELGERVTQFAYDLVASEPEWDIAPGRMVLELLVHDDADKGTALDRLSIGKHAIAYAGDDLADLAAFRALRARATPTCAIAIGSRELPEELARVADEVFTRDELLARLETLAADLEPRSDTQS